ncbi:MAG: ATP-dependent zinc metalloprotease FtsH [Candidatus Makana argininalis]
MNNIFKNIIIWLTMTVICISMFQNFNFIEHNENKLNYSTFMSELNKNKIKEVSIKNRKILFTEINNNKYITYIPINDPKLLDMLLIKNVKIIGEYSEDHSLFTSVLISCFPIILIVVCWLFFIRQIKNSGKGIMSFGKNKAKMLNKKNIKINFNDIAGCDEAKKEVSEIVDYLKDSKKFKKLGGKMPKGILMIGPPGTGKTLLAKAISGEARVPFFSISGSDFVEMFVGVGASRVRDMFEQAKKSAPCIIFIDEIDAVGRKRSSGFSGGNDEREQTLNQMLVEMDGFEKNEDVIIIAATNRPDVLDSALLRPGRFDRQVIVDLPDLKGREKILDVHIKNSPISSDVNLSIIARGTPGFSGADLSNLINEAALYAASKNKIIISMIDLEKAKDKIIMGSERKSLIMTESQKEYTAYHESGHVIIGRLVPDIDPIHKVTIIPRGKSLGATFFLPKEDMININRQKLESQISTLYGGRVAEEIIYGNDKISSGSFNDIKVATSIARNMVTKWGFSEKLGPILYSNEEENEIYEKKYSKKNKNISDKTKLLIDKEIKFIIKKNYDRAKKILIENIKILHNMKNLLIKNETIDSKQIHNIMKIKKSIN